MRFLLQPFTLARNLADLRISAQVSRHSHKAAVSYTIHGSMGEIIFPPPADEPLRKPGLWEETCLEFFLALKNAQPYWEVNLSPSGHWNVYRFSAYREGMQEEAAFASLPCRVVRGKGSFQLDVDLPLDGILGTETPLELGISAVIKLRSGQTTYWALSHPGKKPDFHLRESFIAKL